MDGLARAGHFTIGLLPKLGYLGGISQLLQGVVDFFDRASAQVASGSGKISTFMPVNGSAM